MVGLVSAWRRLVRQSRFVSVGKGKVRYVVVLFGKYSLGAAVTVVQGNFWLVQLWIGMAV